MNLLTHYKRIDASAKAWLQARPVLVACVATGILSAAIVEVVCLDIFYAACGEELDPLLLAYHGVLLLAIPGFWLGIDRLRRPAAMVLFSLCAGQGFAQDYVQLTPVNYTITTRSEINIGAWRNRWVIESEQTHTIANGQLEVVSKVWFHPDYGLAYFGSKIGAAPIFEDRALYHYTGGQTHPPISGEHIRYSPAKPGTWLAATNQSCATNMEPYAFTPTFIGSRSEGDGTTWRTYTLAPALECRARNLATTWRVLVFRGVSGPINFDYDFDFAPGETRTIALGAGEANRRGRLLGLPAFTFFTVDLENSVRQWPL